MQFAQERYNQGGRLVIGGADAERLCEQFGTPLYVVDEDGLREQCRQFTRLMRRYFPGGRVAYACKAFCCKEMCRIVSYEGLSLDIVSRGELSTALAADVEPKQLIYHGYNKPATELLYALQSGVGRIVCDDFEELLRLDRMAQDEGKTAKVLLRITPGVEADTHRAILTGAADSKFGFSLIGAEAMRAVEIARSLPHLKLCGLHCHIGSQIPDIGPFEAAAQRMADLLAEVSKTTGVTLPELNLGGGYAIAYTGTESPPEPEDYLRAISAVLHRRCAANGLALPEVTIEPGRSVAGPFGVTLYRVGAVKQTGSGHVYVGIDGGMTDNPRYALYKAPYAAAAALRMNEEQPHTVTLAGRSCESGDTLGENLPLQTVCPGELVAVFCTGAYNFSMASAYNRLPRPAVVMVSGGTARLAVRRQTITELMQDDV